MKEELEVKERKPGQYADIVGASGVAINIQSPPNQKKVYEDTEMQVVPPKHDPFRDLDIYMGKIQKNEKAQGRKEQDHDHGRSGIVDMTNDHDNSLRPLVDIKESDEFNDGGPMDVFELSPQRQKLKQKTINYPGFNPGGAKFEWNPPWTEKKANTGEKTTLRRNTEYMKTEQDKRHEAVRKESKNLMDRAKSGPRSVGRPCKVKQPDEIRIELQNSSNQDENLVENLAVKNAHGAIQSERNFEVQKGEMANFGQKNLHEIEEIPFHKEVDFHHQIAYKFEKAYGLQRDAQLQTVIDEANRQIQDLILNQEWIIEFDPMIVFYCLYFCVHYNNKDMLAYIKQLIEEKNLSDRVHAELHPNQGARPRKSIFKNIKNKIVQGLDRSSQRKKIDEILFKINAHGLDKLSDPRNAQCQEFFHVVFYQAIEDNIRLVYDQIMGKLSEIYLRDRDALHFIRQRDWAIIEKSFEKTAKGQFSGLNVQKHVSDQAVKQYKRYSRAYYQEIIIKNDVEARTQKLFRQKFLRSKEAIDQVLEMYCQIDDLEQFSRFDKQIQLTQQRVQELFLVCLKNDSFKIAFHLNQKFGTKFDKVTITALNTCMMTSEWYFEIKLFFCRQSFPFLNVTQMDELLSLFDTIFARANPKLHPLVNCFNPVKCSLLVYEICWRIQQKNIYSLQRKCDFLMKYLTTSLDKYFNAQGNINHLYRLMKEPVLHQSDQNDSMDLIYMMGMDDIIQHKVVEEVLNLVYDGRYSIDTSTLYLSSLWNTIMQMDTFSTKSVFQRLITNINGMGAWRLKKQSSIQFHIWKQCIRQRETDEMIFMCLVSVTLVFMASWIVQDMSNQPTNMKQYLGGVIYDNEDLLTNADEKFVHMYCIYELEISDTIYASLLFFKNILYFCSISYIASVFSQFLTVFSKQNVNLDLPAVLCESTMIFSGFYIDKILSAPKNDIISTNCKRVMDLTSEQVLQLDTVYTMQDAKSQLNPILPFPIMMSCVVVQHCINVLSMLRRTENIGPSIIMMVALRRDLAKFFFAFSLPLIASLMIGAFNTAGFTQNSLNAWNVLIQLFSAFTGEQQFSNFKKFAGQTYLVLFILMYFVLLLNLLIAMFSNTYQSIFKNSSAIRLRRILEMKNYLSFDPIIGAVTTTFFPINVIMIPLMIPVIIVKNKKLNEMINKFQYAGMILLQSFAIMIFQFTLSPIMYVKMVLNSFNIMIITNQDGIERYLEPFFSIIASPFIIVISILVDLISLPSVLLAPEEEFEEKYQRNVDELNNDQLKRVNAVFTKVLFKDWQKYDGRYVTYNELMSMHRSRFGIMENLNDLLCRGSKDYKESLASVQDFNATKVMTRICSVPSQNGDITKNRIYFDMLKIINLDIQLYNHIFDMFNGGRGLHADFKDNTNQDGISRYRSVAQVLKKRREAAERGGKEENALDDDENVSDQFMRDPYDVMSIYQTNMLCESFTDVNKYNISDNEKMIEGQVTKLYEDVQEALNKEECDAIEKIYQVILKKGAGYKAKQFLENRDHIPIKHFMQRILQNADGVQRENGNDDDQMQLDYVREQDLNIDGQQKKKAHEAHYDYTD